jgi:hypothetical protein
MPRTFLSSSPGKIVHGFVTALPAYPAERCTVSNSPNSYSVAQYLRADRQFAHFPLPPSAIDATSERTTFPAPEPQEPLVAAAAPVRSYSYWAQNAPLD